MAQGLLKLFCVLWPVLLLLGIGFGVHTRKQYKKKRLLRAISRGRTKAAVKSINRQIYHCLLWRKWKRPRKHTDAAYQKRLQEAFPIVGKKAWNRYFEIVRKASYSRETVTKEEAKECYMIYLEVKGGLSNHVFRFLP